MNHAWDLLFASHYCGRWRGTEFRIAYSLYAVIALLFLPMVARSPVFALTFCLLPLTVLAHEIARKLAAEHYGVPTETVILHALGGAAQTAGIIPNLRAEILIAFSAPFASLLLGGGSFAIFRFADFLPPAAKIFALAFGYQNALLALFTLLPIFPLAGGRIVLAICVFFTRSVDRALKIFRPLNFGGIALLALCGLLQTLGGGAFGILLIVIAAMLYFNGANSEQMAAHAEQYYPARADFSFAAAASRNAQNSQPNFFQRWLSARQEKRAAKNQAAREELDRQVDQLLARISDEGIGKLSAKEREILLKASHEYRRDA